MNNYPQEHYPNLYQEILEDAKFRYGKFNPSYYPRLTELPTHLQEENNNND